MEEKTRSKNPGGKMLPQDVDAEKSLLGAIMLSEGALPEILTILNRMIFTKSDIRLFLKRCAIFTISIVQLIC